MYYDDYCIYKNVMSSQLDFYFNNCEYSDFYLNQFKFYIWNECVRNHVYPTYSEMKRFLKKEITFEQIRDIWQEVQDDCETQDDYDRIINDRYIG